jgi:hypothetical protein
MGLQELAQWKSRNRPGEDVIYATFERVPPKLRRTGRSHKHDGDDDPSAPDPFDEVSPIAIRERKFRDNNRLLAVRIEQTNCRLNAAGPLHKQPVRFYAPRNAGRWAPGGDENHCSWLCIGLHRSLKLLDSKLCSLASDWP